MTTAIALTAATTIINGQGLAANANVISQISTFQNNFSTLISIYSTMASADANVKADLNPYISTIGQTATHGKFLVDQYPANVTPVCSGNVYKYAPYSIPSVSNTIKTQAQLPFAYGMAGFANVYGGAMAHAQISFESVASVSMLENKTYAESGLGYTGPLDLATNGIGNNANLIANTVATWGTMYDVGNMNNIGDPYVFGQNLLNQGFGQYGNLSASLTAVGLNVNDLTRIPQNTTSTTQTAGNVNTYTSIGPIVLPTVNNVSRTTSVSGNSVDVVLSIYANVTGANLTAITNAANITIPTTSNVTSLADYLTLSKVVSANTVAQLNKQGVTTLSGFGKFIHSKIGQGTYRSWQSMAEFLRSLEVPQLSSGTTANANAKVISSATATLFKNNSGGSGPLQNTILNDYFGATAGDPYNDRFANINANFSTISNSIGLPGKLSAVKSAVDQYIADYNTWLASYVEEGDPPVGSYTEPYPDSGDVSSTVSTLNSALASVAVTNQVTWIETSLYTMLNHLDKEVQLLHNANVTFNAGYPDRLKYFGETIGLTASDKEKQKPYQFFQSIITHDANGDTIKLAVAEVINTNKMATQNIPMTNDPNPNLVMAQANRQNIPLNTYISRNK